jgi:phosphate/phosphite/phosphonate ABC transporter binding protein
MQLTFGYAAPGDSETRNMTALMQRIGVQAGASITVCALPSYDRVAQLVHKGQIDLAWVSPIPFIALVRNDSVIPLASPQRGGTHYHGAIVVGAESGITDLASLRGKRAAWVDRYSAAGFVVPRIELAKAGFDVKNAFASQRFYGSHSAAVQAVARGKADLAATFVRLAPNRAVVGGPWLDDLDLEQHLRVFAIYGEIPPDVIAARQGLDAGARERVREALLALTRDEHGQALLAMAFGAEGLFVPNTASYEALRQDAAAAVQDELLDIEEELDEVFE